MKILVTGGAGFIGSQVVDAYVKEGHQVTVVDDLSSGSKNNLNPKAAFVPMDVRDPNLITLFAKSAFELVNHHAAQIDVRKSVQDPFFDASVNILGTLRLLDCCRTYGVRKFILASSGGTVYGECTNGPASEEDAAKPASPYGFSKAAAETYVRFYGEQYKLPYTILRYGNVYGPRQDPTGEAGVVAIFVGRILAGEQVTIYSDGKQERDYVSVKDVVDANVAAVTKGENETVNIGTGSPVSVSSLYERLCAVTKTGKAPIFAPERRGELRRSVLNNARALKVLKWKPSQTLDQGLAATFEYFSNQKKSAPRKA
jgi:UDP-glucose 4-epimerase